MDHINYKSKYLKYKKKYLELKNISEGGALPYENTGAISLLVNLNDNIKDTLNKIRTKLHLQPINFHITLFEFHINLDNPLYTVFLDPRFSYEVYNSYDHFIKNLKSIDFFISSDEDHVFSKFSCNYIVKIYSISKFLQTYLNSFKQDVVHAIMKLLNNSSILIHLNCKHKNDSDHTSKCYKKFSTQIEKNTPISLFTIKHYSGIFEDWVPHITLFTTTEIYQLLINIPKDEKLKLSVSPAEKTMYQSLLDTDSFDQEQITDLIKPLITSPINEELNENTKVIIFNDYNIKNFQLSFVFIAKTNYNINNNTYTEFIEKIVDIDETYVSLNTPIDRTTGKVLQKVSKSLIFNKDLMPEKLVNYTVTYNNEGVSLDFIK
jgi:hypothetical protein